MQPLVSWEKWCIMAAGCASMVRCAETLWLVTSERSTIHCCPITRTFCVRACGISLSSAIGHPPGWSITDSGWEDVPAVLMHFSLHDGTADVWRRRDTALDVHHPSGRHGLVRPGESDAHAVHRPPHARSTGAACIGRVGYMGASGPQVLAREAAVNRHMREPQHRWNGSARGQHPPGPGRARCGCAPGALPEARRRATRARSVLVRACVRAVCVVPFAQRRDAVS